MNIIKEFILPVGVLTLICLVVSGALSYTYGITQPIIEENQRQEANKAIREVLPEGDDFIEKTDGLAEGVDKIYIAANGTGAVAQVTVKGYGGNIVMMAGVGQDESITGVKVLENSETQGLGSKAMDPSYANQFVGKTGPDEVESISGATVSSTALKNGIKLAMDACLAKKE